MLVTEKVHETDIRILLQILSATVSDCCCRHCAQCALKTNLHIYANSQIRKWGCLEKLKVLLSARIWMLFTYFPKSGLCVVVQETPVACKQPVLLACLSQV